MPARINPHLHVCPMSAVPRLIVETGARHLVTVINRHSMLETPEGLAAANHLKIAVNDIEQPSDGLIHPSPAHIDEIIRFARAWNRQGPLIVHCWAGISRSTAAALITLCTLNPHAAERDIALRLRKSSPTADPNRLMIAIADETLGRRGRMVEAVAAMGPSQIAVEGVPFSLPSHY